MQIIKRMGSGLSNMFRSEGPLSPRRRVGIVSMIGLTAYLFCGATQPETCQPQPQPSHTGAEVAGVVVIAGVVIGAVVLVHVAHSHHELKGCILSGPDGLQLRTEDDKHYKLSGDVALVHEGDTVKIKGDRIKRAKGSTDDQTFIVQKLSKDYGACKVVPHPSATSSTGL